MRPVLANRLQIRPQSGLVNHIKSVQCNFSVRGLSHVSHIDDRLLALGLESLETRRVKFGLICCYKSIHGLVNLRFDDFFSLPNSRPTTRGHSYKLTKQYFCVDARKYYFSNRVVDCWNCLPYHVLNAPSLNSFKKYLSRLPLSALH